MLTFSDKGAKFLPNPVVFSINEVVFAVTTADSLFPLRTLEYVKDAPYTEPEEAATAEGIPKDNISRACRHLLRQRSFYPIFPAPLPGAGLDSINLDVTHMDLLRFDEVSADVVVVPSKLGGQFIKVLCASISCIGGSMADAGYCLADCRQRAHGQPVISDQGA